MNVPEESSTPSLIASSGVVSVGGLGTGRAVVQFDRDISHCALQATLISPGGGYYIAPSEISLYTKFFEGAAEDDKAYVAMLYKQAPADGRSFAITAFC